jgi:hypothetical protein
MSLQLINGIWSLAPIVGEVFLATLQIQGGNGDGKAGSLNSFPQVIVASPGPGKYLEVVSCHFYLKPDGAPAAYDQAGNTGLYWASAGWASTVVSDAAWNTAITTAVSAHRHTQMYSIGVDGAEDAALRVLTAANWHTAGAGNSALHVDVLYRIRNFTF